MKEVDDFVGLQAELLAEQSMASEVAQIYREVDLFIDIPAEEYHADKEIVGHSALVKIMRSRGCAEFCVNGQSTAGESLLVRKHNDNQEARSTARTAGQPAGRLQEA